MKRQPLTLASLSIPADEVRKLVEKLIDPQEPTADDSPFQYPPPNHADTTVEFKGFFRPNFSGAKAYYEVNSILFGPVGGNIYIEYLRMNVGLNDLIGIPRQLCVGISTPCGDVNLVCLNTDLGTWSVTLMSKQWIPVPTDTMIGLDSLEFRDKGSPDGYNLYGSFNLLGALINALTVGIMDFVAGAIENLIRDFLSSILGDGEIARMIIDLIIGPFEVIKKFDAAFEQIIDDATKILWDWLAGVFPILWIQLDKKKPTFPKEITILQPEGRHARVFVPITTTPTVQFKQGEIVLQVFA